MKREIVSIKGLNRLVDSMAWIEDNETGEIRAARIAYDVPVVQHDVHVHQGERWWRGARVCPA